MKNIMVVGVLDKKGSTNIPQALAFTRKGFNVIPINYRTIIKQNGIKNFYDILIHAANKYKPILILFSKCNGIDPAIVKALSEKTATWLWNMDPVDTIKQCPEVIEHAKYATFSSCTSIHVVKWFEENGVNNCHFILEGLDCNLYKPVNPSEKYKADISFIGTRTNERDTYISMLSKNGYDIKAYGSGYSEYEVVDEEFSKVCSSSKYMLSLNTVNNVPHYFSDRLIRYTGCGSCTLHLDSTKTLNNYFVDGEEVIYFSDQNDLIEKLSSITEEQRKNIIINGRERTLREYTWNNAIDKILTIAFNKQLSVR